MSRKNKILRAFLHQTQSPTIEQAWDTAWEHAQKAFHARSMQDMEERLDAAQAECEKLRSILIDLKDWDCDVSGGFLSIPVGLRRRMQEAIDAAIGEIDETNCPQPAEQQPAEGEEIMVNTPYDVFTLPLQPSGLGGKGPRFVVHVPGPEQPAAHPAITHCDNCGCDWLDNGLNPIGCPYCKQNAWRAAFVAERATRYREGGMAIEQARIHAETDATLMEQAARQQPAAVDDSMVKRFPKAFRNTPGDEAIGADEKVARRWLTAALSQPAEQKPAPDYTFIEAMKVCEEGLREWREKPHNKRWWKMIDGTPIPNDLLSCIAESFAAEQQPAACRCVDCGGDQPEHDTHCAHMHNLHVPAPEQQAATINVTYTDGVGAARRRPEDCRYGVSYVTVADTVYWPLSADDAQRLRSAECGRGEFTGPANECPDVSALVEALEKVIKAAPSRGPLWHGSEQIVEARAALATHRKQGGEA